MQVSEKGLEKFIAIYRQEIGDISVPEARILASQLLDFFKVTCRPIGDEEGLAHKSNTHTNAKK